MRYIKLINNEPINYTIEELFQDNPDAKIYKKTKMPNEKLLSRYNVFPLITTDKPDTNEDSIAEEGTPVKIEKRWYQSWDIRKLTEEEIAIKIEVQEQQIYDTSNEELLNTDGSMFFANKILQEERYNICKSCPSFTLLKTCKECGCIMTLKTRISDASCPLEKW